MGGGDRNLNCMAELDLIKEITFVHNLEGGGRARRTDVWEKAGEGNPVQSP